MKLYVLESVDAQILSFHATKKDAEKEKAWWDNNGLETEFYGVEFKPTRGSVVSLLNIYGKSS